MRTEEYKYSRARVPLHIASLSTSSGMLTMVAGLISISQLGEVFIFVFNKKYFFLENKQINKRVINELDVCFIEHVYINLAYVYA